MIIFGTRASSILLTIITFVCGTCHNAAAQRVMKRVTKFTLFFIPLFPVAVSYRVDCAYCGAQSRIDKAQADSMVEFVQNADTAKLVDEANSLQAKTKSEEASPENQ